MSRPRGFVVWIFTCLAVAAAGAKGADPVSTPFVEGFDTGVNNWRNAASADLNFVASGGPDGSSYASTTFNLLNAMGGAPGAREASMILVRGRTLSVPGVGEFVASDGAFFGDWLQGVGELRLTVRHNTPEDLFFFARLAVPANSPAVGVDFPVAVAPNEWTELVVPIDFSSPLLVPQGGGSPESILSGVFSNVGNIQFGFYVPTSLAGIDQVYSLDIDNITLTRVPEPATLAVVGVAGLGCLIVRRIGRCKHAQ